MPRHDQFEKMHKKRKGGGWNPSGSRRPPMNPQGNYSDILPRVVKDSQSSILGRNAVDVATCSLHHHGHGHTHARGHSLSHDDEPTLRSNIHVVVRIRPKNFNEKGPAHRTIVRALGERIVIFDPKEDPEEEFYFHGIKQKVRHDYTKKPNKNLKFAYDRVYGPHNTNNEIFETSVKKLVSHIIDGFNCSIFAYGATGAGKTYTMLGSFEHPGLTFLMAMELYNRINGMANEYESEIVVSYLEVYNETLRDLLHPSGILSIREDGFNGVNIPNLTMHKPKDASELLGMLSYGNSVRTQHPTDHNAESSRSHAVFQVSVSLRKRFTHKSLKYKMAKAKLVMVDLAGSERGLSQGCDSQRFREGANINKSLLALSNCINALADGHKHVPYRDSKLTRILKDSLGGNCKTVMIANVAPSQVSYDDTYNTLKYAGRAKEIRINCKKNFCTTDPGIMTYTKMVDDLQLEIQQLKSELQEARKNNSGLDPEMNLSLNHDLDHNNNNSSNNNCISNNNNLNLPMNNLTNFRCSLLCDRPCDSPSQISCSPLITPTQNIPDPVALENFIQLLSQKKKLEEDHAEASIQSKELEWALQWKKWKIEAAKFASNGKSLTSNALFLQGMQGMKTQYESLLLRHKDLLEKVHLAKQVLDFNEREIDLVGSNCLNKLAMEDPFLTVTLREFLYYKSLEREVSAHKSLENYHQKMSLTIFEQLLSSETILGNSLKFLKFIYECLQDRDGVTEYIEAKQNEILGPLYGGEISLKVSSTDVDQEIEFPPTQLLQELWELMRNPVVEYDCDREPQTTMDGGLDVWDGCDHDPCPDGHEEGCCCGGEDDLDGEVSDDLDRHAHHSHNHHHHQHRHQLCDLEEASSCDVPESLGSALQSVSTDTVHNNIGMISPVQTASLENSSVVTGTTSCSSNDVLTLHRPKKYVSVESLFDRGLTARTVPFSAVPSNDSAVSDDARDADDATDFEEAIKYSNSDLLEYMDTDMKKIKKQQHHHHHHLSKKVNKVKTSRKNNHNNINNNFNNNNNNIQQSNNNTRTATATKGVHIPQQSVHLVHHHHQHNQHLNNQSHQHQPWLQAPVMTNSNNIHHHHNHHSPSHHHHSRQHHSNITHNSHNPVNTSQHQNNNHHHPHQHQTSEEYNKNNNHNSNSSCSKNNMNLKNPYYSSPRTLLLGEMGTGMTNDPRPLVYDNAGVQVSETDLITLNNSTSSRPLTFCYPNSYNNNNSSSNIKNNNSRNVPLYQNQPGIYPGHQGGDR